MKLLNHKFATLVTVLGALLVLVAPQYLKNYGIYLLTYWLIFIIATMG
ncbi:MAG: branched-chain amino acid ABC transporter permease, partial [Polaromonas sp.]